MRRAHGVHAREGSERGLPHGISLGAKSRIPMGNLAHLKALALCRGVHHVTTTNLISAPLLALGRSVPPPSDMPNRERLPLAPNVGAEVVARLVAAENSCAGRARLDSPLHGATREPSVPVARPATAAMIAA
jgi:hypothetical protein